MKQYGPIDAGQNCPMPAADGDQSDFPGVPGHNTPMHPGFNANKPKFSPRTHSKHRGAVREQVPMTPAGNGGGAAGPDMDD